MLAVGIHGHGIFRAGLGRTSKTTIQRRVISKVPVMTHHDGSCREGGFSGAVCGPIAHDDGYPVHRYRLDNRTDRSFLV